MELRFVAANDDVKVGDTLLTSGVDGIYPAGVPVATVTSVNRQGEGGFAHIGLAGGCRPAACASCCWWGRWTKADTAVAAAVAAAAPRHPPPRPPAPTGSGPRRDEHHAAGADQLLLPVNPWFMWASLLLAG
jgi:rod shape-determining protein MreC